MKYIYLLLISIYSIAQLNAKNWVLYEVIKKDLLIPSFLNPCDSTDAFNNVYIDLDCASEVNFLSYTAFSNINNHELEIANILRYYPQLEVLEIVLINFIDTVIINELPANINYLMLTMGDNHLPFISIGGNSLTTIEFRIDQNNFQINSLPQNLQTLNISNAYNLTIGDTGDTLNLVLPWPPKLKTFECSRLLNSCNDDLPNELENFATRYSHENKNFIDELLNKNKALPNFDLLTLFTDNKKNELYDLSSIDHIKRLKLKVAPNSQTTEGIFYISQYPKNLKYLELERVYIDNEALLSSSIKTLKIIGYYNSDQLSQFPNTLDTLWFSNASLITMPNLPDSLIHLQFDSMFGPICLPIFPNTMRSFENNQSLTPYPSCIPNETQWIKASAQMPLCTSDDFICNIGKFETATGNVYLDINYNGIIDNNDHLLSDAIVTIDPYQYTKTEEDGTFEFILRDEGDYHLSINYNHRDFIQSIPAKVTINYQKGQPIDSVNFLIQIDNKNDVQINGTNLVARPGMSTNVTAFVENLSLENKSNLTVKILKPADWTLNNAIPSGYAITKDTIVWKNISIERLKKSSFSVSSTLPPTATILGDAYKYEMWVENEGDVTPEDNYYSIIDTIIGSYDPNDKIVNHNTLTPELSNSKELIYTIRFQNTGTDTAFQVVVIDTIIGNLNPTSIRVLGASHNYTWDFTGNGIATFVFDNILLPDSNVNEPGSHGFVTLALRPSKDLAIGDSIYNRAGIYFDFNEPVITNHANTKIATVTPVYSHSNIPLSIYPNPAKNQVRIEWKVVEPAILRISDISGKIIRTERLNNGFTNINVSQLPKGLYIVQLQSGQDMAVSKLIVQ